MEEILGLPGGVIDAAGAGHVPSFLLVDGRHKETAPAPRAARSIQRASPSRLRLRSTPPARQSHALSIRREGHLPLPLPLPLPLGEGGGEGYVAAEKPPGREEPSPGLRPASPRGRG